MKVLFATPNFGTNTDTNFAPLVATDLQKRGHHIVGVQYRSEAVLDDFPVETLSVSTIDTPHWIGQWLLYRRLQKPLKRQIAEHDPDVVVADRMAMVPAIVAGEQQDIPVVGVVPGLGFARYNPLNLRRNKTPSLRRLPWSGRVQYPFVRSLFKQQRRALQSASRIVVISNFLADVLDATFGVASDLVHTPVRLENVRAAEKDPCYLTMVNPRTELKGAEILFDLAECMDEEFLVAGEFADNDHEERAAQAENVTHLGWVADMREVYRQTRIVVVPSLVEEGGGPRVVLEGFANGIPAVGTSRGAIPEHVADAGAVVDDPFNIDEWKECINRVLANYDAYARRASDRAGQFDAEHIVRCFERLLRTI